MANDGLGFEIPISFNKADLNKSEADFKKFVDNVNNGLETVIQTGNEVSSSIGDIKLPTQQVNKLNNEFNELQKNARQSIQEQKNALAQLVLTGKKGTKEFNDLEASLKSNIKQANELEKALDDVEGTYEIDIDTNADEQAKKLDNVKSKLKGIGKGIALGGIALIGAGLAGAVKSATEVEKAMSKVRASTGLVGEEAEKLKDIGKNLYTAGFGEGLGDTIEQVGKLKQSLGKVVEEKDFAQVSEILAGVSNATGEELSVVGAKSRTFIQNFEGDAVEAANLIAFVSQNANNAQEDVLDTLDEYSGLVKQAGISSQAFSEFLVNGIEAGARNTDKLADGLKEAAIRINAGDYASAFKDLSGGLSGESKNITNEINNILQQAESGSLSISEALAISGEKITEGLESGAISKDLGEKLTVAIAGTPAEDVGTQLFASLLSGLDNTENDEQLTERGKKAADLYQKSIASNVGGFAGLQRSIEVLLADVGDAILPVINVVIEAIKQILPILMPVIDSVAQFLAPVLVVVIELLEKILPTITNLVSKLLPALVPIVELVGDVFQELLVPLMPLLDVLIDLALQVLPVMIKIMTVWIGIIAKVAGFVIKLYSALYTKLLTVFKEFVGGILQKFGGGLDTVAKAMGRLGKWIDKIFDKFSKWLGISGDTQKATDAQAEAVAGLTAETQNVNEAIDENVKIGGLQTNVLNSNTIAMDGLTNSTQKAQKEVRKLNEALIDNTNQFKFENEASKQFAETLQKQNVSDIADIKAKQAKKRAEEVDKIATDLTTSLNSLANLDFAGAFTNFSSLFEDFDISQITDAVNDFDTDQLETISSAFNQFAINTTKALTSGEGGVKEGLKNLGISVIDGLEAIIPAVIAKIAIEDALNLGLIGGLLAGAGASVALYSLLELAKSGLQGAEQGGLITDNYKGKVGKTDDRIMAVGTGEFIVNRNAVQKGNNLDVLKALNNGEDLSNLAVNTLGDIVYGGTENKTLVNDFSQLETSINNLSDSIGNTKVEIIDRGRIEINDNRKVQYKQRGSHRG